jgi:hypothetical protein
MDRREFVHITALGSAAGVVSFTGLGVLWEDDSEPVVTGDALSAERDTPTARTTATRTSSDTPTDPPTVTETSTERQTEMRAEAETATESPTPRETATATEAETATPTATTDTQPSVTATPHPSRGVEAEFQPIDDYREVYVRLQNTNSYAVEATATVSWRFEDGSSVRQSKTVEMGADSYWAGEFRHSEESRTFDSWGHELTVTRL